MNFRSHNERRTGSSGRISFRRMTCGKRMGDGSRLFFLMDHKHREETPILRKCQEFSRELLAFATAATRARVRGSVTFLLGCDALSIAPSRAFLAIYLGVDNNDCGNSNATFRGKMSNEREQPTARRDERDARAYRYYADRPFNRRDRRGSFAAATAAFDLRLPPSRGKRADRRHPLKWQTMSETILQRSFPTTFATFAKKMMKSQR